MSKKEQLYKLFPEFGKEEIDNLWEIFDGDFVKVGKDLNMLRRNANATDPPPRKVSISPFINVYKIRRNQTITMTVNLQKKKSIHLGVINANLLQSEKNKMRLLYCLQELVKLI